MILRITKEYEPYAAIRVIAEAIARPRSSNVDRSKPNLRPCEFQGQSAVSGLSIVKQSASPFERKRMPRCNNRVRTNSVIARHALRVFSRCTRNRNRSRTIARHSRALRSHFPARALSRAEIVLLSRTLAQRLLVGHLTSALLPFRNRFFSPSPAPSDESSKVLFQLASLTLERSKNDPCRSSNDAR